MADMTNDPTITIHEQVQALDNLLAFAKRSGIPYRTLNRIKADADYQMSKTTRLALVAALRNNAKRKA